MLKTRTIYYGQSEDSVKNNFYHANFKQNKFILTPLQLSLFFKRKKYVI